MITVEFQFTTSTNNEQLRIRSIVWENSQIIDVKESDDFDFLISSLIEEYSYFNPIHNGKVIETGELDLIEELQIMGENWFEDYKNEMIY